MNARAPLLLGITLGDAAGIGPEVALRAAMARRPAGCRLVLIGSLEIVRRECRRLRCAVPPPWNPASGTKAPSLSVWSPGRYPGLDRITGRASAQCARAATDWIRAGVHATLAGDLDGIVTAPISKEGLARAGLAWTGHTEMLADLTRTRHVAMMLIGGPLRVVLATRHIPLAQVARRLTRDGIVRHAVMASQALRWMGLGARPVGICGLNPHAGDGGTVGREEITVIGPAVRAAQRQGVRVAGPVPADVIFYQARRNRYGAIVAMYHDQGLGPLKMLAFERGVNLTLGLPIVRTSPDHGTAYDIAGRGVADPRSMGEAIRLAARLARRPNPWARGGARRRP